MNMNMCMGMNMNMNRSRNRNRNRNRNKKMNMNMDWNMSMVMNLLRLFGNISPLHCLSTVIFDFQCSMWTFELTWVFQNLQHSH